MERWDGRTQRQLIIMLINQQTRYDVLFWEDGGDQGDGPGAAF